MATSHREALRKALKRRFGDEKARMVAYRLPSYKALELLERLKTKRSRTTE